MPFYWIVLAVLVLVSATLTLLMFTPVVVSVDSRSRRARVRWSFLLSYVRSFPGAETAQKLSVAGISVPLPRPKREAPPKTKEKLGPGRIEASKRRRKAGRFIRNCLLEGNIRSALMRHFRRLPSALWGAVEVSRLALRAVAAGPGSERDALGRSGDCRCSFACMVAVQFHGKKRGANGS